MNLAQLDALSYHPEPEPAPLYLISGCGISAICGKESLIRWINDILERGGTPLIQRYKGPRLHVES